MTQKTAVEWLASELKNHCDMPHKHFDEILEQAKQMEKDIIITANEDSSTNEFGEFLTGEQYYNKMYGNKNDDHTEQHLEMVSSSTEISDEEIEKAAENYGWKIKTNTFSNPVKANELAESAKQDFIAACKWYREQLKKK